MNTLLTLRGKSFTQKSRNNGMGPITVPKNTVITLEHLKRLYSSLEKVKKYWEKDRRYYNEVIRRELMNKELPKNVTPIINLEDINKSSMTNSLAWSNYNNLLTVSLYSPKYIENNYLDDEEKKEYNSINDLKFLDEEKRK